MPECGFPLPCESTISSDSEALTITNNDGTAIAAVGANGPAVTARSNQGSGITAVSNSSHGVRALSGSNHAVFATSLGASGFVPTASSVFGDSSTGPGVVGSSASNVGVMGRSDTDRGVFGTSRTDPGVVGESAGEGLGNFGVVGSCNPGTGVLGTSANNRGVTGAAGTGTGVFGTALTEGTGVFGNAASGSGVEGNSAGGFISAGVFGNSDGGFISAGVFGIGSAQTGVGVFGRGQFRAGFFDGDVQVTGSLIKSGGGFRIDHPLEPARKSLSHSFVESPEMKNIYDGVVALDENGECLVELPEWFEALNCDFRYQLTSIGEPAPNLHVAREISNNHFNIAGGKSGVKVSWQVTGIRKDAWAQAHPLTVDEEKPENERGYYLHPELYGQPQENSTLWKGNAELLRQLEEGRDVSVSEVNQVAEEVRHVTETMLRRNE